MEWGEKRIVPLNITEETQVDEDGAVHKGYRADLVPRVEQPLCVDNIVDAAIAAEFDEAEQKRIMRNLANSGDEEVERYRSFVAEITAAAREAGYE